MTRLQAAYKLIRAVGRLHGVTSADILGRRRFPMFMEARKDAVWYVRQLGFSYPQLGEIFKRDHTTLMSHCQDVDQARSEGMRTTAYRKLNRYYPERSAGMSPGVASKQNPQPQSIAQ